MLFDGNIATSGTGAAIVLVSGVGYLRNCSFRNHAGDSMLSALNPIHWHCELGQFAPPLGSTASRDLDYGQCPGSAQTQSLEPFGWALGGFC